MKNKLEIIDDFLSDEDYNDLINNLKELELEEIYQLKEKKYDFMKSKNLDLTDEVFSLKYSANSNIINEGTGKFIKKIETEIKKILDDNDIVFCTKYVVMRRGFNDHIRIHCDDYFSKIGYAFYTFDCDWKVDYGGLLHSVDNEYIETVVPKRNRLVMMDQSDLYHWVTPVNSWAKNDRKCIVGFGLSEEDAIQIEKNNGFIGDYK